MVVKSLAVVLLLTGRVLAQEPAQVLRGTWTAAADAGLALRGTWSAQAHRDISNAASGSWTLVNDSRVVLQGMVGREVGVVPRERDRRNSKT